MKTFLLAGFIVGSCAGAARAGDLEAKLEAGHSAHVLGRLEEAASFYRMALRSDLFAPEPHLNLGVALLQNGRTDEAVKEIRQSIRSGSRDPLAQMMLALSSPDTRESREAYRQAVQGEPAYAAPGFDPDEALLKRRLLAAKTPRSTRNKDRWASFSAPDPPPAQSPAEDPGALDKRGRALDLIGDFEGAIAAYRSAIQLAPDSPKYHGHLAAALSAQAEDPALTKERAAELRQLAAAEYSKAASLSN